MRKLTIKGKDFKIISNFQNNLSITYNKIIHEINNQTNNIHKNFIWNEKNTKINYSTLSNSYEDGDLKGVYIFTKVISMKISMNGK